ncbi:MAG: proteasome subunit beta, partial [Ilumatobacteraceae bacterium]
HAATVMKMGFRSRLDRDSSVALVCRSLWEAAEADSATGGPDMVRGIFPIVAVIDGEGWNRVTDEELETVFTGIVASARESSS